MKSDASQVSRFRKLADAYLAESHERFPEHASRLGYEKFNARLGANDVAAHRDQIALTAKTLLELEAQPEAAFHGDDWLDRRMFVAMLRTDLLNDRDLQRWRVNPQGPCDTAVDSIFDLLVRHTDNLPGILPAIEARLEKIPDYLAAGAESIRNPVPLWTKLARRSCEGAVSFLGEVEAELVAASKNPERTKSALTGAIRAFERYAEIISRKKPGPVRGYSIGRANFEFLMRERLGFDISLPEARANGHRLVAMMTELLEAEARRLGGRSAKKLLEEAAASWTPERPLLDEYRAATLIIKKKLRTLGIATLPKGENLQVLPAPPFLRHQFPTAAYNAPPPFSKKQEGIFWVNDLSLGITDEAKRLAEVRQHFGLELTTAHEGYPGHHLQFAIQNQHKSTLRRLANHSIYYEGWTMWCEHMSVERGLAEGRCAKLQQIHDALWRAYRIIIDCGLHDGTLDYNGACQVLMDGVGFTKARAGGDVNWYTSSPTIPMSYLLGRIEVEKLYQRFVVQESWSLKKFNDWMLGHGAIPWSWIVKAHDAA
jgi:uncharacterized protein (DUF885 family)